jgi:hypothetical protein
MTTKQKQTTKLEIDLDAAAKCPSDALIKCYQDADAMDTWIDYNIKPEYQNNRRIWAASKGSGNKVKHSIFALYRLKVGRNEYLFFYDSISTKDYFGNSLMTPVEIGRWSKPTLSRTYGINPGTIKTTVSPEDMKPQPSEASIECHETIYDFPWTPKLVETLKQWYEEGIISPDCKFYAWGSTKYGVQRWEDFIGLSFQDLELLGQVGNRFNGIYSPGDAKSMETVRSIIKSELEKGILNPNPK